MSKTDVLHKKQQELNTYMKQFDKAVSMVTSTVENLGFINENIETQIREIDAYQAELENTKVGLVGVKSKNERVIKNFSALLCNN